MVDDFQHDMLPAQIRHGQTSKASYLYLPPWSTVATRLVRLQQ